MQATTPRPASLYIFQHFTISELAVLSKNTGKRYSEAYLLAIRQGSHNPTDNFRQRMSNALHVPEDILFAVAQSDGQDSITAEEDRDGTTRTQRSERS